jgi:cob(I)alamin adenosyltransferase
VPGEAGERLRLAASQWQRLEAEVTAMNAQIPALTSFIMPAGSPAATYAHLARTVTRRAERHVVTLSGIEEVNPEVLRYLNRLSDHLFVLSRRFNGNGATDVLWVPGLNR